MDDETRFFSSLPEVNDFARVTDPQNYVDAPASSQLVISDVRGSTQAIEAGRYRDVNALGVASIIALCNATPDVELAYVFGGDGATVLVPGVHRARYEAALRGTARVAKEAYGLELRTAVVPVAELVQQGHPVRVLRFRTSPNVCLAMFAGSGLGQAERWVKDAATAARFLVSAEGPSDVDFEGFECRWQPVDTRRGTIACLLVQALASTEGERELVYRRVLECIAEIAAQKDTRPVSVAGLKLRPFGNEYEVEARLRAGTTSGDGYRDAGRAARKKAWIGRLLMGAGISAGGFDGKRYPLELVENTDFRKFDETLRMVLDLSASELSAIEQRLVEERNGGHLAYGIHRAPSAIVTCFVRSHAGNHVHFVDGANGGYALAAKQLKAQLKSTS